MQQCLLRQILLKNKTEDPSSKLLIFNQEAAILEAGMIAQSVYCLSCKHKALSLCLEHIKMLSVAAYGYNPKLES